MCWCSCSFTLAPNAASQQLYQLSAVPGTSSVLLTHGKNSIYTKRHSLESVNLSRHRWLQSNITELKLCMSELHRHHYQTQEKY